MESVIEKTIINLQKNNMSAFYAENKNDALNLLKDMLKDGMSIGVGGSVTLDEVGVLTLIRDNKYNFFDRYDSSLNHSEVTDIMLKSLSADAFICSSNAVTENGELFNVDGNGNRVAALCFGPKKVIVIVGKNKIVNDIKEAVKRLKSIAAPLNTKRLSCKTPCEKTGKCVSFDDENSGMCDGCLSPERICGTYVISAFQRNKDRIKVIICGEDLGY